MFLDQNADLPEIAAKFSCTVFFGEPDDMLKQFERLTPSANCRPHVLTFEKDDKKSGITIDISQELVRLNVALPASTPEVPNFLLVKNAELLNVGAGNALLKTFEEARQHFVLLAKPHAQILPTILSRSAVFYLPTGRAESKEAQKIAKNPDVATLATALDKKPDLALEVLNLLAQNGDFELNRITNVARAVVAGNGIKLAFLSYL
jgi:DNA polymerase III delta prime subunit